LILLHHVNGIQVFPKLQSYTRLYRNKRKRNKNLRQASRNMARDDILLEFMNELTECPLEKSRSAASDSSESHNDEDTSFDGGDNELDSNNDNDNDCSNTEVANFAQNNFASFHWQQPLLATRIEESVPAPVNFFHANSPLFVAGIRIHQVNLLPPDTAPMHLGIPQHRRENVYLARGKMRLQEATQENVKC